MSTPPAVAIAPPPRCFDRGENRCGPVCGKLARWMRVGKTWFDVEYFCDDHRAPGDAELPDEHVFRRVGVFCDVYFAGVSINAPLAQTEAVSRLEEAIRGLGGALDVHQVRSHVVKSLPPRRLAAELMTQDTPE